MKSPTRTRTTWPMWVLAGAAVGFLAGVGGAQASGAQAAGTDATRPQTHCPMMGGEIDRELYTDVDGKRVYFCCAGCVEPFLEDAAALIAKMEETGVAFEEAPLSQPLCPVSGKDVARAIHTDHGDNRIYFCSDACREAFEQDPQPYLDQLAEDGVELEPAPGAKGDADEGDAHEEGGHGHAHEESGHGHAHEEGGHGHAHEDDEHGHAHDEHDHHH